MARPHDLLPCWIAAAVLAVGGQLMVAQAVSPEHWCAGPGVILNGTRCPMDDSALGSCPPGCEAKHSGCGATCQTAATVTVVFATVAVIVAFCYGVLSPILLENRNEREKEEEDQDVEAVLNALAFNNPLTKKSSVDLETDDEE